MSDETLAEVLTGGGFIIASHETFQVVDYSSANWTVERAQQATTEIARIQAQAAEWKRQIDEWEAKATAEYRQTVEYMQAVLEPFVRKELEGQKRRSVTFPAGIAGFRKGQGKLEYTDEAAVLAWAKEHCPWAVKQVETVLKQPVKDYIKEKGEIPDGADYEEPRDHFYIKPLDGDKQIEGESHGE